MQVIPSTIVAGQSFELRTTEGCMAGTQSVLTEVLPAGAPVDGATDSTHATWRTSAENRPDRVYRGDPALLAGNYDVAAECMQESWPWGEPAPVVLYTYRTSLKISEGGRRTTIDPESVSPGGTITVTPDAPCVSVPNENVYLYLYGPSIAGGYEAFEIGTAGPSCEWGPVVANLPTDIPPGEYSAEVLVNGLSGPSFAYIPTRLVVT